MTELWEDDPRDELKARIMRDPALMHECLESNDFAGWLVSVIGPMENDALEFGERVKQYILDSVEAMADDMAREIEAEQAEYEADAAHESRLIDQANRIDINRRFA